MRLKCRNNYKFHVIVVLIFIFSALGGLLLRRLENPFLNAYTSHAYNICNEAVNDAIDQCFQDKNISYDDIITLREDSNGRIISLSANTFKINQLKAEISRTIDKNIESHSGKTVKLHLGATQDNLLASSLGPSVRIKIKPYSATKTSFRDEFISAGINQVRHCIYLDILSSITLSGFCRKITQSTENTILVADTVIVGTVPEFYGNGFTSLSSTKG